MNDVIERMAPSPATPDPEWAAATLRRITRPETRPSRRRKRWIVAGIATGAVCGMGVAAAETGLVPQGVLDRIGVLERHAGVKLTTEPVKIADIHLSDGSRWQIWRGLTDHSGACMSAGDPNNGPVPDAWSSTCSWQPGSAESDDRDENGDLARLGFYADDERGGLPIAYGQVLDPKVETVRIFGPGYSKTLKPDKETGGFGLELPQFTIHHTPGNLFGGMKIAFLDEDGDTVRTLDP